MRAYWIIATLIALTVPTVQADIVQVREAVIRDRPSFLGKVVGQATFGEALRPRSTRGPWVQVSRDGGGLGWVHRSALTRREVVFVSGEETVSSSVSSDELALAGKGFSQEVEARFRARHGDAGFKQLDRMEELEISPEEQHTFFKQGGLVPKTGRQP